MPLTRHFAPSSRSHPRRRPLWLAAQRLACCVLCLVAGCAARKSAVHAPLRAAAEHGDALAVSDALEALIAAGIDTPADRQYAYDAVSTDTTDTAAATYGRASVTGRLVQQKGLLGASLVPDVERNARRSRELDPTFRDGAATRLLGTLYVLAPASFLQHGDSEEGLDLLVGLVQTYPNDAENHLRLAEAYIALGDPAPAAPHLCRSLDSRATLRRDEQLLLANLIASVGSLDCRTVPRPAP
jgi:hypothetical protein